MQRRKWWVSLDALHTLHYVAAATTELPVRTPAIVAAVEIGLQQHLGTSQVALGRARFGQAQLPRVVAVGRLEQAPQLELQHGDLPDGAGELFIKRDTAPGPGECGELLFYRQPERHSVQARKLLGARVAQPVELGQPQRGQGV